MSNDSDRYYIDRNSGDIYIEEVKRITRITSSRRPMTNQEILKLLPKFDHGATPDDTVTVKLKDLRLLQCGFERDVKCAVCKAQYGSDHVVDCWLGIAIQAPLNEK